MQRWHALDRDAKVAFAGIGVLVAGAIAVRAWLMLDYGPAFLGFGDSHEYVAAAALGLFHDVQKPAGYPIFLALLHLVSDRLTFTILVQHALGVATGLLLYASVRRAGVPAWLGLAPAAIAFFGGTGLLLEHALLADSLFAFLQAVGVYAAVRALGEPRLRWALCAGLAIGVSFWVKTVGLSSAVLVPPLLLLCAPGAARRRLASAAACAGVLIVVILGYVAVQAVVTGYVGYQRQSAWNLYGRVATFVDCSRFTPPAGTRFLCPTEPPARRQSESYYQYARAAPAVRRFGGPAHAPGRANALLQRFSVAAIEHEPIAYAGAIVRGLTFYVSPRGGEGYTPESIREALLERKGTRSIQPAIAAYYPHDRGYEGTAGAIRSLASYERDTRVQGTLLIALLAAAVIGTPLLRGRVRSAAILFTLTAILSVIVAEAGNGYDARYGYPAFGPLAAGAALGAWGLATRLRQEAQRSRRLAPARTPPS
ncbi:MAG: glycosyltransferase family 39 protein [Solirubrobacteraceae bacterium]